MKIGRDIDRRKDVVQVGLGRQLVARAHAHTRARTDHPFAGSKNELRTTAARGARAEQCSLATSVEFTDPAHVDLRLECRRYELGWLWSFGRRADLLQLTHHPAFRARHGG